jgi:hypothetical protein
MGFGSVCMNIPIYTTTLREDLHLEQLSYRIIIKDYSYVKSPSAFVSEIDVDS